MEQLPGGQFPDALGVEKGNRREVDDERLVRARYVAQGVPQLPEIPEVELAPDRDASPRDAYLPGLGGNLTLDFWARRASSRTRVTLPRSSLRLTEPGTGYVRPVCVGWAPGTFGASALGEKERVMDLGGIGNMQQYLEGINFPANKDEVASGAEGNGAPQDFVDKIRNAAQERFNGPQEVLQTVGG